MQLKDKVVILTGATGGIGSVIATQMINKGAKLLLVGRKQEALAILVAKLSNQNIKTIAVDLLESTTATNIVKHALDSFGRIDILINNAGVMQFKNFSDQNEEDIKQTINTNLIAPMLLTHATLPTMRQQQEGMIVNIGSVLGSIGFAWYSAYSASKFGLRGFSESLRRELKETGIQVSHISPRAVDTEMNDDNIRQMAKEIKMPMDSPELVGKQIIKIIESDTKDSYIGFPESLFVRINSILPRIVDMALRSQNKIMAKYT